MSVVTDLDVWFGKLSPAQKHEAMTHRYSSDVADQRRNAPFLGPGMEKDGGIFAGPAPQGGDFMDRMVDTVSKAMSKGKACPKYNRPYD